MNDITSATAFPAVEDRIEKPPEYVKPLADYMKMFDDYRNIAEDNRRQMSIDVDYYDGKQLTLGEKRILSQRGQPDIVINRVRVAVNGIVGVVVQSKADPRCYPRTPADDDAADVGTDVLRYITHASRFNQVKAECFWGMLVPGIAATIIEVEDEDNCVRPKEIRWEEFFYDPRSRRRDFKDALYMGIAKWMYASDVEDKYGAKIALSYSSIEGVGGVVDDTMQDRPTNQGGWLDVRGRRVMVVEVYHRMGNKWYKCVYYAGGILEEAECAYVDDKGRSICPIEATTCYVDRELQRHGVVRDMRDIQDEINKRRSKLLHLVSSHQIQASDPSAIEVDVDTARKEAARPDGVIPYGWEIVRTTDMSAGQMQLLSEAKNEMERMGPNPAVLGRQGSDSSGRAILARQQAGLVELALVMEHFDDWENRVLHQCWWRAKQYWRDEKFVRTTDNPDDPKFITLNKARGPEMGQNPETGEMVHGEPQYDADGNSVHGYDNDMAQLDLDIIVDTAPETANIMQEMIADLIKLVSASPNYAAQIPFEVFIELSPIPRKRMIMDRIKQFKEEQQQQQGQQQQMQMQAALKKLEAEIGEMKAKAYSLITTADAAMVKAGGGEPSEGKEAGDEAAMAAQEAINSQIERQHQAEQAALDRQHEVVQSDADRQHQLLLEGAKLQHAAEQKDADRQHTAEQSEADRAAQETAPSGQDG